MSTYRLGWKAGSDLAAILDYSVDNWGEEHAEEYRSALESCFETLATSPRIGRGCGALYPELRRFEHRSHVIFYLPIVDGVLISRVLHKRVLPRSIGFMEVEVIGSDSEEL